MGVIPYKFGPIEFLGRISDQNGSSYHLSGPEFESRGSKIVIGVIPQYVG